MIKNLKPKLAEAGKIKIGGLGAVRKGKGGKEFRIPKKLDHFLITDTIRNENGDLAVDHDLLDAIGTDTDGKVRAIPIVLHSDEIDEVFPTSYALYTGRKCACRGDGEQAIRREIKGSEFTGKEKTIPCPCDFLGAKSGPQCKPNGKLYCSIVAKGASVAGAVHVWRTTSIISIEQMIGSLLQIKSICGTLRGVPLWLRVKPITVEPDGKAITVYCCFVELREADIEAIQARALREAEARDRLGYQHEDYRALLTTPGDGETPEEQAEIEAEFYAEDVPEDTRGTNADDVKAALEKKAAPRDAAPRDADGNPTMKAEDDDDGQGSLPGDMI